MNMIESHMEQIALSSAAIVDLPFPPPRIFTNALLHPHDITSLIRDTEAHERALFKVAPPEPGSFEPVSRRKTVFPGAEGLNGGNGFPAIKSNTAVGRILGGDFLERMRRNERQIKKERNDVDVEVLLRGAEKLCNVYPVPGVMERINDMRRRHQSLASSIAQLEEQIEEQSAQLSGMNRSWDEDGDHYQYEQQYKDEETETSTGTGSRRFSVKDFEKEESEMKALERKRRGLEDRVSGMDKDLGGLMR